MRTGAISIVAGLGMALGALAADPAMAQRPHETMGGRLDGSTFPVTTRPAPVMAPGLFPGPVPAPGPVPTPGPAPLPPGTPGFGARRFDPHQAQGAHRDRDRRRGQPGVVYVLPPPYYYQQTGPAVGYDPSYAYAPSYDPGPMYAAAAPMTAAEVPAPPPPPEARTIEFPSGRYELQGDGASAPFNWVWIPSVPPTPTAPPAPQAAPGPPSKIYRWVDDQRVVHFTDNLGSVPEQYRDQAKQSAKD